ncbi:MAG: hypothetical protein HY360_02940 [Verrucomicrobia bacterium]|nr:hypothetical protein [Verrucomicrobiota bacterium]
MTETPCPAATGPNICSCDEALQKIRMQTFLERARQAARTYFDATGRCVVSEIEEFDSDHQVHDPVPFHLRERVNCALAFLGGAPEDVAFGNAILSQIVWTSCGFTALTVVRILRAYPDRLSNAIDRRLRDYLAPKLGEVQSADNGFLGMNDNFPSMDTCVLVLGGEILGDARAVQAGVDNLYALRDLLGRRGFSSEYNSPTYAAVTLCALDDLANHARHAEARSLARQASERMWLDVAAHWHPALSFQAGPYSRAYHHDSIALGLSLTSLVMWITFGDAVFLNPTKVLFDNAWRNHPVKPQMLPWWHALSCGFATTVHSIPDYISRLVMAKTFPYRVGGTTECGSFHDGDYRRTAEGACIHVPGACADFGANAAQIQTYMEPDFAVGTASRGLLCGSQTDLFHVLYRLRSDAASWADLRALFARYLVNDTQPEGPGDRGMLYNCGNGFAVQDDRRALVLYYPKGNLRHKVRSLKLSLVLQEMTSRIEEIWIGDRKLSDGDGEADQADWVILRDGPMLLAFLPLAATNLGRKVVIRSTQENKYRVISFYNYEGAARDFQMHELQVVPNGFIFEASTLREHKDVPAFLRDLRKAEVSDSTVLEARRVRYLRDGRELFLWMDAARQTIQAATVNGRPPEAAPLRVDGVEGATIPWHNPNGLLHRDLSWWKRIAARKAIPPGNEAVSGRRVDEC